MMDGIKKFFSDIFTEPNNTTVCPVRIIGILGTLQGLIMVGYDVFYQHNHIDLQAFGIGLGVTLTALGAAMGLKKDTDKAKD